MITARQIRRHLRYDARTGLLWWRLQSARRQLFRHAGGKNGNGYTIVQIFGKQFVASRLIWLIKTGHWPKHQIDHKNNRRTDNRWSNLRSATSQQNKWNARTPRHNTSGFKGVSWATRDQKWRAQIKVGDRPRSLGAFDCPREAHAAYVAAAKKHFGEFARAS